VSNIAEARGRAIPIVTSYAVVAGAGLTDGVDAFAADTPHGIVDQVVRAYSDPLRWNATAASAERHLAAPDEDDLVESLTAWASGAVAAATNNP
jgi:hypothetical protein